MSITELKERELEIPTLFDLKDEKILYKIANAYNPKIINETENKIMLFCSCVAKDLPAQYKIGMGTIVISPAGAGKSTLVDNILLAFENDSKHFTKFTEAFYKRHFHQKGLDGVILHHEQEEQITKYGQLKLSIPKFQLSEGKTIVGLSDKNEKGQHEARILTTTGYPIYITTSTNHDIEEQDKSRLILLESDKSDEQTKSIKEFIARKYSHNFDDNWNFNLNQLRLLADIYKHEAKYVRKIRIPFSDQLSDIIDNSLESRRDFPRILNSICHSAFIHVKNRRKVRYVETLFSDQYGNTEEKYVYDIIADVKDFENICEYGQKAYSQTLNKINKQTESIVNFVKSIRGIKEIEIKNAREDAEKEDNPEKKKILLDKIPKFYGVNSIDVCNGMNYKQNYANELLRQGKSAGYLSVKKYGKENYYIPTTKGIQELSSDKIEFSEKQLLEWYETVYGKDERYELV